MNLRDICFAYFGWFGEKLSSILKGTEHDLDAAYMKVHPDVYFSFVGFAAFLTAGALVILSIMGFMGIIPLFDLLPVSGVMYIPIMVLIPVMVIVIGVFIPKTAASNRMAGLKIEIPYASMYISTMTSGGLSPYESFLRLGNMDLLPNMQNEVSRIETIVISQGVDPVSAMEQAAKVVDIQEYKELLLGYASTVRTGGDTLHYLFNQTESMFRSLSIRIKGMGENMGMLMEAYTIIGILGVLGIFLIYVVGLAMPSAGAGISSDQFFLFSFVLMPMLSGIFIYFADAAQISYPVSNWNVYMVFAAFLPVGLIAGSQLVLPAFDDKFLVLPIFSDLLHALVNWLNLAEGTEAALGLAITLIIVALPGLIADNYFIGREGKTLAGINHFLRDLVETRKSGLSPERCIHSLSGRDYGQFSKHLKKISMKLNWGIPLRKIYEDFREDMRNWLALINIYLLIDTIEVGGGSEESLETLASFAESMKSMEDEKSAILMPLTIVPFIGAALLTGTTVMFLQFFTGMGSLGVSIASVSLYKVLLTPLALHSWTLGLVTGMITSGRVSAGFKFALLLPLISILGVWGVSNMGGSMIG